MFKRLTCSVLIELLCCVFLTQMDAIAGARQTGYLPIVGPLQIRYQNPAPAADMASLGPLMPVVVVETKKTDLATNSVVSTNLSLSTSNSTASIDFPPPVPPTNAVPVITSTTDTPNSEVPATADPGMGVPIFPSTEFGSDPNRKVNVGDIITILKSGSGTNGVIAVPISLPFNPPMPSPPPSSATYRSR